MSILAPPLTLLYRLDRLRGMTLAWLSHSANALLYCAVVVVLGVGTSLYAIDAGTRLTTLRNGPWVMWTQAGQREVDPYTRARYAKIGALPVSSTIAATWEARFDADGRRLHSSCEYLLEGDPIDALWFNIAVYDDNGLLIPNAAERYSFTSQSLASNPDGSFFIVLARDARPGNWLPVGGAGRLVLVLTILEPKPAADATRVLPTIRKIGCR